MKFIEESSPVQLKGAILHVHTEDAIFPDMSPRKRRDERALREENVVVPTASVTAGQLRHRYMD